MSSNPLTIAQLIGALGRQRFRAFFAWLLVMIFVVAAFLLMPRKFGSEGRLYVQMGRNNTGISPLSDTNSISIQDTRETEIRSVVQIIKSRAVFESVVDEIGADEILGSSLFDWMPEISLPNFGSTANDDTGMSVEEYNERKKRERAATKLEDATVVYSEKQTSVISVYVTANSAKLAQRIVDKIFEHTRRVHLRVHASKGSAVFFDEQFEAQQVQVVNAVKELAEYRNKKQILSIDAARESLKDILTTLDNDLLKAEVDLAEAEQRLVKLGELMDGTEAQIAMPKTGVERLSYEDAHTVVFNLEAERERLIATYQARHPEVQAVEAQLKKLKKSLQNITTDRTESASISNPVYEAMQVDLMRAKAIRSGASARVASLKQNRTVALTKLAQLNVDATEADQLRRNVDVARQYLAIYTQKRGESKAMSILDDLNISDVVVAQDANFVVKHVSPKGSLFLPLGFICGLLAALATALFFERNHLSATLKESDVEQILDLPVLVTLPRVYSSRNMVN